MSEPTSVYLYQDAHNVLIYVGITKQGPGRQNQHNSSADWWRYVAHQDVEHYDTRDEAKARETWLIKNRRPPFNRQENPEWPELRRAYLTLFDPDVLRLEKATGTRGAKKACGHCGGCQFNAQFPDHPEPGICRLHMVLEEGEEPSRCRLCGRIDCVYTDGVDDGLRHGWYDGYSSAQGRIAKAAAKGEQEFAQALAWRPET
jgi:predicted GIY-YIG superfamily endonuclease